ncbi:hypothetical protein [Ketogulonicigenium vulgare]|uniref:Uncharacterized protein n=1 Tax=Ketogulonicigenium vulgare (strain WSH-001) TaxID=759362 RepID=F9Y9V0_KETVW|nr:hypothetical protein [Ketogulonicigenium vulgare]ADO41980.1 conserved hypothetical protein [Ketogulonicigenium vulgare Y25]AEM40202.1 hypothetical protein KVU_0363 [Ketogulonicigenium vulgare WSH-001]ALJ80406.1 hypothetical protein KVH_03960 [Ketogulonicigenium vulgare]ANW33236.1 hypothetical protein KvSKV_03930 [Ketogulonicigenium vulgare]AOZ53905.1 hypothetical protein KVC_0888 [Ketogulonicigenium vulgare]
MDGSEQSQAKTVSNDANAEKPARKPRAKAKAKVNSDAALNVPTVAKSAFNILIVAQAGRLQYEALLFAAALRQNTPNFAGRLIVAEPQPSAHWDHDPRIAPHIRKLLQETYGATIRPFTNTLFGQTYPYGNKIEALATLPAGENFIFFDTDTMILGDLSQAQIDFSHPTASMRREGTWPVEDLYWPGYTAIWKSLYDKFDLPFEQTLDLSEPDEYWERYLYFNAGWFLGSDPVAFSNLFTRYATEINEDPPEELVIQPLNPWLDQVALPLVVTALGGGRPGPALDGFDGALTCHYRTLPLLYARESDTVVAQFEQIVNNPDLRPVFAEYAPFKRMAFQGDGAKVRGLFNREKLPRFENRYRQIIKAEGLWMR